MSFTDKPISEQPRHLYGFVLGSTAMITLQITSNPQPRAQWSVDGITIEQGQRLDRLEALVPEGLGGGVYNITLAVAGLTLEDTTKHYLLTASNELGATEYSIRISSSEAAPVEEMDIGAIIGIVVGVAVIVIIVVLIVIARATGRWCFSG